MGYTAHVWSYLRTMVQVFLPAKRLWRTCYFVFTVFKPPPFNFSGNVTGPVKKNTVCRFLFILDLIWIKPGMNRV